MNSLKTPSLSMFPERQEANSNNMRYITYIFSFKSNLILAYLINPNPNSITLHIFLIENIPNPIDPKNNMANSKMKIKIYCMAKNH